MNSKTTFWAQVGAAGTAIVGTATATAIIMGDDPVMKKVLGITVFIGTLIASVAKSVGGVATADAEPGQKNLEAAKIEVAKAEEKKVNP